jgi:hypothetical protein
MDNISLARSFFSVIDLNLCALAVIRKHAPYALVAVINAITSWRIETMLQVVDGNGKKAILNANAEEISSAHTEERATGCHLE